MVKTARKAAKRAITPKPKAVEPAAPKLLRFDVFNRWTGAVQFTAAIDCRPDAMPSLKIGLAVKWAFKSSANLVGANLVGANLVGANLVGANLVGARLDGANLVGARLDGARLDGASLVGASLVGARLVGASLVGARLDGHTLGPGESLFLLGRPNGWYAYTFVTKEGAQYVRVGCKLFTLAEGRRYWHGKEHRREVMAALDYAEAVGRARNWTAAPLAQAAE